jgi:hypothetical protein
MAPKPCNNCGAIIHFDSNDKLKFGSWRPINADGTPHSCLGKSASASTPLLQQQQQQPQMPQMPQQPIYDLPQPQPQQQQGRGQVTIPQQEWNWIKEHLVGIHNQLAQMQTNERTMIQIMSSIANRNSEALDPDRQPDEEF